MLFNLKEDPYEQNNLALSQPNICNKAANLLLHWHDEMMLSSESIVDPLWTVINEGGPFHAHKSFLDKYLIRLRETGRSEGAIELEKRHKKGKQ